MTSASDSAASDSAASDSSSASSSGSSEAVPRPPGWIVWSLRVTATGHLAGVLVQAALAGLFVTGDVDLLAWHRDNAGYTHALLYAQVVAAVLLWRPGRGPGWPVPAWAPPRCGG
ncbi:hypothetical protein AB0K18_40535 [Nonomuraea sp. NPDC049421]|uniref:hypothetical protein n=1 Tax=Nonomuraea sp. NPDC049421 TaxID=3155275 RepID=UPI00344A6576